MADNVVANAGSGGATFATDDIVGIQYPRSKICWGADGVANDADVAAGKALPAQLRNSGGTEIATAAAPLRTDPTGTTTQPVSGSVSIGAALPAGTNKLGGVDLDSDIAPGSAIPAVATFVAGSDGTLARALKTDTGGELQVDVLSLPTLPAGTNKIGAVDLDSDIATGAAVPAVAQFVAGTDGTLARALKTDTTGELQVDVMTLPALPTGANNIGDVDVLTLPAIPAGANKIGAVDLDSDATIAAAVPTVAQFVAGSDGTSARALKTDAGGELQVDVLTLPALPAGGNNIGDVDVLTLPNVAQATAASLKCEPQGPAAHDAAVSGNPLRVAGRATTSEYTRVADGDVADLAVDAAGRQIVSPVTTFENQTRARLNLTTTTDTALLAADVNYKYAVMAVLVTNASATVSTKVAIRDGVTDIIKGQAQKDGGGFALSGGGVPLFIGTVNTALNAQCGTTGADVEVFVTVAKVK